VCLAEVDNAARSAPALRIDQMTIAAPAALMSGLVSSVFSGALLPASPACNLNGTATTNWILELDSAATMLTLGAARTRASAGTPFVLVDEMVPGLGGSMFHVQPITTSLAPSGAMLVSTAADIVLPAYLDAAGTQAIELPLSSLVVTFTPDATRTCIGSYNAAGLDPSASCAPDSAHPAYLAGGNITGFIRLEDADNVPVSAIGESLCVLLSRDPATYGDSSSPVRRCRRDAGGTILLRGDWCAATNASATPACADAMHVDSTFAASGVLAM
jgi:hypothetical protein